MAKQKGTPKTGGCVKGTPKKRFAFSIPTVQEVLESENCEPLRNLCRLTEHEDPMIQLQANRELCKYIYPTVRTVEVKAEVNAKVESSQTAKLIDELFEMIKHVTDGKGQP